MLDRRSRYPIDSMIGMVWRKSIDAVPMWTCIVVRANEHRCACRHHGGIQVRLYTPLQERLLCLKARGRSGRRGLSDASSLLLRPRESWAPGAVRHRDECVAFAHTVSVSTGGTVIL